MRKETALAIDGARAIKKTISIIWPKWENQEDSINITLCGTYIAFMKQDNILKASIWDSAKDATL